MVGHVEWIEFLRVDLPPAPGAIMHATEAWTEPAGGGGVAAVELARLAGSCALFTSVGSDDAGTRVIEALAARGVTVHAPVVAGPHRRGVTLLDPSGERTITVIGAATAPEGLAPDTLEGIDGAYFCHGDAASAVAARGARVLVATARVLPVLQGVLLDALVYSGSDPREQYAEGDLDPVPRLVARTEGTAGGAWHTADGRSGRWSAVPVPGPVEDTYGAGDCFAAGLTWALARGLPVEEALRVGAERGALALTRRGGVG